MITGAAPLWQAVAWLPLALALFSLGRLAPIWRFRHQGCDAYFFLQCAEAFRRDRRVPIELSGLYLLEPREQWYPPLFPVLLGVLPERWVARGYWALNTIVDMAIAAALFIWVAETADFARAWAALLLYATDANFVSEYRGLTSRPLSAVLYGIFVIAAALAALQGMTWLIVAAIAGMLVIYTHKLTTQLLWFAVPFLTALRGEWVWLAALAGAYLLALAVKPSLFVKVQRAHWDIVAFWHRNWNLLGAHQIRNSPVYGREAAHAGFHRGDGPRILVVHGKRLFLQNPWVLMLLPAALQSRWAPLDLLFVQLTAATYLWAAATLLIPWLRSLGEGTKYVKYATPFTLALAMRSIADGSLLAWAIGALCLGLHLYHYQRICRELSQVRQESGSLNPSLQAMIERFRKDAAARILCLPAQLADLIAYASRRPVLWGTHGYGFKQVESFFPVLRQPVEALMRAHGLTYLLVDSRYVEPGELRLPRQFTLVLVSESYRLFAWSEARED
ncbi:MAG TPA: hypothetical protein VKY65_18820 [Alphaproteobacteria bacterium]|nr:hypothetical protein [Alphaproteobacteria bacterium]